MRFLTYITLFLFIIAVSTFTSCRKEIDIDQTDIIEDVPVELIFTNISGQVTDIDGEALKNVQVTIRNESIQSDENGYFAFNEIKANENGTKILASKDGYFNKTITVYPSLNHSLFSSIILHKENSSVTMLSWEGGNLDISNNSNIYLEPNTLVYDDTGNNFEGSAHFSFFLSFIDEDEVLSGALGEFSGLNSLNELRGLHPKAMLQMKVTDGKGRTLRLAKGQSAEINIGRENLNSPEDLPMWNYNSSKQNWIKSGLAVSASTEIFSGRISNFNPWLLATDYEIVQIDGMLTYEDMNAAGRHQIEIRDSDENNLSILLSDDEGHFGGHLPKGKLLDYIVKNDCGQILKEGILSELNKDSEIELSLQESEECMLHPISGILLDCYGSPVTNGYVKIMTDENIAFLEADKNGHFEGEIRICNSERFSINALDKSTKMLSYTHDNLIISETIQIKSFPLCNDQEYMFNLSFNNEYYFITEDIITEAFGPSITFKGESDELYIECGIFDFKGASDYFIKSELEAEFLLTVSPQNEVGPELFPKDSTALETYKLKIESYNATKSIKGNIEGLAKDINNNNIEGMMYINFVVPDVQ